MADCVVSGTVYDQSGAVADSVWLTVTPLSVTGILLSAQKRTVRAVAGVVTFTEVQGTTVSIKGDVIGFTDAVTVTIPSSSTATLESLAAITTYPTTGLTVKDEGTALATLIGTVNFAGAGVSVAQTSPGVATVTVGGGIGSGTVTSVGLALPNIFTVSGSPVTIAGTLTGTLATQVANTVFAGPATGGDAIPTFRALVAADVPDLSAVYSPVAHTHTFASLTSKPTTLVGYGITDAQALDADLTAIAALAGTSGLLRKTAADTWSLDTAVYLTSVQDAVADGATKGIAAFTAGDFDSASGVISLDYTNAQKATGSVPGLLSSADWTTFNNKQPALGFTAVPDTRTVNGHVLSGNVTVTASDVGLGSVENTALSTWAGSTNLTTLGTIGTGTWNATIISLAKGGTGVALTDPAGHRLMGWDDTDNAVSFITIGSGLTYTQATHTLSAAGGGITVGTTAITSGTDTRVLFDNAGVVGEYTISGTGSVAMTDSPVFTTQTTIPKVVWTGAVQDLTGSGSPEGIVTAGIGSVYRRTNGSTSTTLYVKESGVGNTGWIAYGPPGGSGAPSTATYITQTADAGLSAEQALSSLASGIMRVATTTGVITSLGDILPSANGGTANAFFTVSGPATSAKTFTFPNASANVLTDNALVTVAQGGTGVGTLTGLLQGNGTSAITGITNSSTVGQVLRVTGVSTYAWGALDLSDTDAITGDLSYANLTAAGAASKLLGRGDSGAGDWQEITLGSGLTMTGTTLSAAGGGGDVVGPASSVDNTVARFDSTTGKLLQGSGVTISDLDAVVINATSTLTSGSARATHSLLTSNPATNSTARFFGARLESNSLLGGNNVNFNTLGGIDVDIAFNSTGTATALEGISSTVYNASGSVVTTIDGVKQFLQSDTGAVAKTRGLYTHLDINGGTVTDSYGAYLSNPTGAGAVTNNYGLYVENQTKGGTLNYSIYAAGGLAHFGGIIEAGSGPTTLTDSAGKILSAALNTVAVAQGGTGQTTASAAFNALAPSKTGNALKFLRVNAGETDYELATPAGSGTVTATGGALTADAVMLGAGGTDSKVLASLGTAGWVLTSNGAGTPPSFQAAGGGLPSGLTFSSPDLTVATAAANQAVLSGSVTTSPIKLEATGSDTDISISLVPKGAGGILIPAGTSAAPSIKNGTGGILFKSGSVVINHNGQDQAEFINATIGGVRIFNTAGYSWTGSASTDDAVDTALSRSAAGVVAVINGNAGQWGALKAGVRDAGTTTVVEGLTVGHQSTGTPAAGLGSALLFRIDSSTTADQDAARIAAVWTDATHATRTADLVFSTTLSGAALAENFRVKSDSSILLAGRSGDPGSPSNGAIWYDSTGNLLRARINGATVSLGAGGGQTPWTGNIDADGFDLTDMGSILPRTTKDLGAATTPFRDLYLYGAGTFGTHSLKLTGTPTGNRTITLPDSNTTLPIISQQLTWTGPTAARTYTLPDAADTIATIAATQTLTNKRISTRITTIVSSATPAINTDDCDAVTITALATNITSMTSGLTGTPGNFDKLLIRIKDDGTIRSIAWGASFASSGAALPTTTIAGKVLHVGLLWDSVKALWTCIAADQEP